MLERFIEDYAERGYQFAYRLCGNAEEAKELTQEAFFRVLRKWESFDQSQPLENWFFTVLRNIYYDSLDRRAYRPSLSLDAVAERSESGGLTYADVLADERDEELIEVLERRETVGEVRRAIDALAPDYKAVLTLCDIHGMKYEQIAQSLGWSLGTVKSRIFRAREALKDKILQNSKEAVSL